MKTILACIVTLIASMTMTLAHGGKQHKKDSVKIADSLAMLATTHSRRDYAPSLRKV